MFRKISQKISQKIVWNGWYVAFRTIFNHISSISDDFFDILADVPERIQ